MMLKCRCGSRRFKPIGIQEGWHGRNEGATPRMLFLVNCLHCGTTLTCNSLNYALMRSSEVDKALDFDFFTAKHQPAV